MILKTSDLTEVVDFPLLLLFLSLERLKGSEKWKYLNDIVFDENSWIKYACVYKTFNHSTQ